MRTENNVRERPDGDERHANVKVIIWESDALELVNPKEFEWLAWNYRAFVNSMMSKSRKNMVFRHFNRTYAFLPSPE